MLDTIKSVLGFFMLLILCCRLDILIGFTAKYSVYKNFLGFSVSFLERVKQYFEFIHNVFLIPKANVDYTTYEFVSWQLDDINSINFIGVIILGCSIVGFFFNKEKISSRIAIYWIGISMFIFLLFGWGTMENGLILYSLYFGWAFSTLTFQFIEKIKSKYYNIIIMKIDLLLVGLLFFVNSFGIIKLLNFAKDYYPN